METKTQQAADQLYREYSQKIPYSLMNTDLAPLSEVAAYDIQKDFMFKRAQNAGGYSGYKIAYTTKVMQERVGASQPVFGRILSNSVYQSPASLFAANYVNLALECEVAVTMASDLEANDKGLDRDTVFDAIEHLQLAFELVDIRQSTSENSLIQSIATNIHGAGVVLGQPVTNWQELDIPSAKCELKLDGVSVGTGQGSDVNGHPVEPMIWIAKTLNAMGGSLKKGDIVITGSMIPPIEVKPGMKATLHMDLFGEITLDVQ